MRMPPIGRRLYSLLMFGLVSALTGLLTAGVALPFVGVGSGVVNYGVNLLESLPAELETPPQAMKSTAYLADGSVLAYFFDENRSYVALDQIAPIMKQAQLAIEDHRFYEHGAIDIKGILRGLLRTASGNTQGGSTLTQQYVKQVLIEDAALAGNKQGVAKAQEQTITRKVQEMRYAISIEKRLTKDQILERYLNIAYYGDGAYGVEAAAHHYFNDSAANLTLAQAAMLAGIVQSPSVLDPVNHQVASVERRNVVLDRMLSLGITTREETEAAKAEPFDRSLVQKSIGGCSGSSYPFICDYVQRTLLQSDSLGEDVEARMNLLKRGGLTIRTTINASAQSAAQTAVSNYIDARDPVLGVVAIVEPGTGRIITMAQSRNTMGTDPGETYYNYAATADMGGAEGYQAGSTFKAFTLASALEKGIPPTRRYDAPSPMDFSGQYFTSCDGKFRVLDYTVKNFGGVSGNFTMYEATKRSVNTYFMQLERDTSLCDVTKMAERMGVKLALGGSIVELYNRIPSFTLGVAEISPLSLAEAYATFAARGVHCSPIILDSVTTLENKELEVPSANCSQVLEPEIADAVADVMSQTVTDGGTAANARIPGGYDQAAKTGTIDGAAAIWTAGFTPEMAGASMIAVDKRASYWGGRSQGVSGIRLPFSGTYLSGSSGGNAGQYLYRPSMIAALEGQPATKFVSPNYSKLQQPDVPVPSCKGIKLADCRNLLTDAGFGTTVKNVTNKAAKGTFLGTSPSGTAPQYSMISLLVSSGPAAPATSAPATVAPPPTDPLPSIPAMPVATTTRKRG